MHSTSASLLDKVRNLSDTASWSRLVQLYTPLLRFWLTRHVPPDEIDDLVQEVFLVLARRLPGFQYDPSQGAFRGWLRGIVANCLRNHWRKQQTVPTATGDSDFLTRLGDLEAPDSDLSRAWDLAHDQHLLLGVLEHLQNEFEPTTLQAFRLTTLEGQTLAEAATQLGVSVNAVCVARSRVLRRLQQELRRLAE